jgi:O-antigen/teichoic acid export membrane protein
MSLRINLLANFLGRGWSALLLLLFTPLLISLLGIEGYGLIGFFNALVIFFSLFDFGFGAALNRELAQKEKIKIHDLITTLESAYWGVSLILGLFFFFASAFLAEKWLFSEEFLPSELYLPLRLMGFSLLFQLPFSLYCNALIGLQRQVELNAVLMVSATLRYLGALILLKWVAATLVCFFGWQLFVSFFQTWLVRFFLKKELSGTGRFQRKLLVELWPFALGMGGITLTGLLVNHLDKFILSRMLPLKIFGHYTLAWTCSNGLYTLFVPFFSVFFPKFSALVANNDRAALTKTYHQASQLLSIILIPLALTLCFFSKEMLFFWTKDLVIAEQSARLVSVLILAAALHGIMQMPFALQFAHGWTRLTFFQNLAAIALLSPLIVWAVHTFGALGGTFAWLLLNLSYLCIGVHLMHRKILPGEKMRWALFDVGGPLLSALIFLILVKLFFQPTMLLSLIVISLLAMLASFLASPLRAHFNEMGVSLRKKVFK